MNGFANVPEAFCCRSFRLSIEQEIRPAKCEGAGLSTGAQKRQQILDIVPIYRRAGLVSPGVGLQLLFDLLGFLAGLNDVPADPERERSTSITRAARASNV